MSVAWGAWAEVGMAADTGVLAQQARVGMGAIAPDAGLDVLARVLSDDAPLRIVMPLDLERWWRDKLTQPEAFGRLCAVLAEAAKRISDYQRDFAGKGGLDIAHGDVKPTNVLMNAEGRWVVSDFGCAPVRAPQDDVWAESRVVVATDNFLAPEVLFHARRPHPAAVDTWSLAASFFASSVPTRNAR